MKQGSRALGNPDSLQCICTRLNWGDFCQNFSTTKSYFTPFHSYKAIEIPTLDIKCWEGEKRGFCPFLDAEKGCIYCRVLC